MKLLFASQYHISILIYSDLFIQVTSQFRNCSCLITMPEYIFKDRLRSGQNQNLFMFDYGARIYFSKTAWGADRIRILYFVNVAIRIDTRWIKAFRGNCTEVSTGALAVHYYCRLLMFSQISSKNCIGSVTIPTCGPSVTIPTCGPLLLPTFDFFTNQQ